MTEPRYAESAAYHESGHAVVAAALGMRLRRDGIHVDPDGQGISFYEYWYSDSRPGVGSEVKKENAIISFFAGLIAQEKFYLDGSKLGADDDDALIKQFLEEMKLDPRALSATREKLRSESVRLVEVHWAAIKELARVLLTKPFEDRDRALEPYCGWSQARKEKRIGGEEIVAILQQFGICTAIFY